MENSRARFASSAAHCGGRAGVAVSCLALLSLAAPRLAVAQQPAPGEAGRIVFDPDRAWIADSMAYRPFLVTESRPLRDALNDGSINQDTPLLVMEHAAGTLALLTEQLAYHHVAQGTIAGEPWMVSF